MRCAYLTTDEVNNALALEWAATCGIVLFPLTPKEGLPGREYDAVLCDWDFWPVELRREMLADLRTGPPPCAWRCTGTTWTTTRRCTCATGAWTSAAAWTATYSGGCGWHADSRPPRLRKCLTQKSR